MAADANGRLRASAPSLVGLSRKGHRQPKQICSPEVDNHQIFYGHLNEKRGRPCPAENTSAPEQVSPVLCSASPCVGRRQWAK